MDILGMLAIAAGVIFFKVTTPAQRHTWWWSTVAVVVIAGVIGLVVSVIRSGSIPAPCCENQR